jgi:hypothetical protein
LTTVKTSPKRKFAWTRPLTVIATVSALVLISGSVALASHAWGSYHWERSSNPLQLQINNNLTGYLSGDGGHFDLALTDWNLASLTEVNEPGLKSCGAVNGRVEVCNDSYGFRRGGWLGVATIWADGDHITKATVQLNDTFLADGAPYGSSAWRQMVMCQEIGHVFGLDHQDEDFYNKNVGTCMDYTDDPTRIDLGGQDNQHPNQHDYDMLKEIYDPTSGGHVDSGSGGGGDGGGNCPRKKPGCSGAALKAPPFSQASRANGSIYVDQMGNGLTRIKHVFWVPPR